MIAVAVSAGANTAHGNRVALGTWTVDRVIARAGGQAQLRDRIAAQAEIVCTSMEMLSEPELGAPLPTLLVPNGIV
ncbi:hypothetical protein ACFQY7_05950 [Actinomadura luteofluorescens]|uniref:Uncharacterized protein n=1 Tax=Actinomadura luteofluorescens TaxID=46163 RepID=A0A7Y9JD84_9ACTN|nr:hypothetical protein [Actinomadura luteofluorescens]NYD44650.1 hypothetical protein [Actinomadura luteofluorescens]